MATLSTRDEAMVFTMTVLGELPRQGRIDDGPIAMNSNSGLVHLQFRQIISERIWLDAVIAVFISFRRGNPPLMNLKN